MTSPKSPVCARTTSFRHCDQPQPAGRTVRGVLGAYVSDSKRYFRCMRGSDGSIRFLEGLLTAILSDRTPNILVTIPIRLCACILRNFPYMKLMQLYSEQGSNRSRIV